MVVNVPVVYYCSLYSLVVTDSEVKRKVRSIVVITSSLHHHLLHRLVAEKINKNDFKNLANISQFKYVSGLLHRIQHDGF